jgi:hypothetical protein
MDDPALDPTPLLRLREGVYAADLAIAAIVELDLFTRIDGRRRTHEEIAGTLGLPVRPVRVMCDVLESLGLLDRDAAGLTAARSSTRARTSR